MIAEVGRYLHQSIDDVMEWEDTQFFLFHATIAPILEDENPKDP